MQCIEVDCGKPADLSLTDEYKFGIYSDFRIQGGNVRPECARYDSVHSGELIV